LDWLSALIVEKSWHLWKK